ncbi:hypothetical protein BJV82DRAFT_591570, partial [Fennellomyces sp. T-0311]
MYQFGPHSIAESQVFFKSKYCLGLVNLKPIAPYVMFCSCARTLRTYRNFLSADMFS